MQSGLQCWDWAFVKMKNHAAANSVNIGFSKQARDMTAFTRTAGSDDGDAHALAYCMAERQVKARTRTISIDGSNKNFTDS